MACRSCHPTASGGGSNTLIMHLGVLYLPQSYFRRLNVLFMQVINAGDALEFLSGGFYKPTIHRVLQPPADWRNCCRLGVFYFCGPDRDTKLIPHESSPVLKRVGIHRLCQDKDAPTMDEWRKGRTIWYGRVELTMKESLRDRRAGRDYTRSSCEALQLRIFGILSCTV